MVEEGLVCYKKIYADEALEVLREISSFGQNLVIWFILDYHPGWGQYNVQFPNLLHAAAEAAWAKEKPRSAFPHLDKAYKIFVEGGGAAGYSIYRNGKPR